MAVSFKIPKIDMDAVARVVDRAQALARAKGGKIDRMGLTMAFVTAHANGWDIDLDGLLEARDFDFAHDVFGIGHHLDRDTGNFSNHFLPLFARQHVKQAVTA